MVANCDRTCVLLRRVLMAASALAVGVSLSASAQTSLAANHSSDAQGDYSSSALPVTDALLGAAPVPSASAALARPGPQYGGHQNNYPSYPNYQNKWSRIAFVGGGGFTAPIGNDTRGYETWGYNFTVGGGWNFTKKFGALFEYQFDRNKIPGATIAAVGAQGGNINSHLFLFDGIYYPYSHARTGLYITGGPGFSRKVTNFTDLQSVQECYYFCYYGYAPVTVASFSSTQLAADAGIGAYWKAFGQDSNAKLFAEARYVFVDSPRATTTTNGEGTEEIIPVTFGIRF
jgi:hypothetical protein